MRTALRLYPGILYRRLMVLIFLTTLVAIAGATR